MFKNPRIHPQFARTLILKLGLLFPHIKQLMNTNWRSNEENPHLMRRVDVYPLRGPHGRHHARTPMPRRRRPSGRRAERHAAPSQRRDRAVGRRGPPCLDVAVQQAAGPPGCSSRPAWTRPGLPCSTGERADLVLRPLLRRAPPPRRYGLGWPAFSSPPSTSKWSQRDRESDAGERGKRPRVSPGQLFLLRPQAARAVRFDRTAHSVAEL